VICEALSRCNQSSKTEEQTLHIHSRVICINEPSSRCLKWIIYHCTDFYNGYVTAFRSSHKHLARILPVHMSMCFRLGQYSVNPMINIIRFLASKQQPCITCHKDNFLDMVLQIT
jgi:hypothetical protein